MSMLFSPLKVGQLEVPNRVVIAPMCQYSAEEGCARHWHLIHLGQLAASGAGLLIIEATAVAPEGRITPFDLGLYSDAAEEALGKVIRAVRAVSDIRLGLQLAHAGRKASSQAPWEGGALLSPAEGGWPTVAPSAVPHSPGEPPPAALDEGGLERIRQAFAQAAARAARLGLDLVEVHAAHGYLLHEFLSPLSNRRTDRYGGSLENRMRFPLEVFESIRAAFPSDRPVGVRISATDWVAGGWDVAQSIAFSRAVEERGCAYVHVSSGGLSPDQRMTVGPGYQIPFARQIRERVGVPVIGVGLVTEPEHAEAIVLQGQADLVALGRGILYDPRWPWHAAARLGGQVSAPRQYWRCQPAGQENLFGATRMGKR